MRILCKTQKILEMLNNGQIEELKFLLRDEIYKNELTRVPGAKQRYAAMKRYFKYFRSPTGQTKEICQKPCIVEFKGEEYTSFTNGFSLVLTKESSGEIELFEDPKNYLNIEKLISFDGTDRRINLTRVIAEAKGKGYKLKRSETTKSSDTYCLHYDDAYYAISLLDISYSIINDGDVSEVWHKVDNGLKPIVVKNNIGVCLVLPINPEFIKPDKITIIEAAL